MNNKKSLRKNLSKLFIQCLLVFPGTCKNGTGAVGCGPQEEFRACADVTITEDDGTADDTENKLEDPEVFVPEVTPDDEDYNEVDFHEDEAEWDQNVLEDEVRFESIIIVVLASILFTVLFFGGLFFYYTRGKSYLQKYVKDKDWPDMPAMPKMPKGVKWPLSDVKVNALPTFMNKAKADAQSERTNAERKISGRASVVIQMWRMVPGPSMSASTKVSWSASSTPRTGCRVVKG